MIVLEMKFVSHMWYEFEGSLDLNFECNIIDKSLSILSPTFARVWMRVDGNKV